METEAIESMLAEAGRAGVYQLTGEARDVARAAERAGLACFRIDIGHAHNKGDFLDLLAKAMRFPDWFGRNWDALADCLEDLSWIEAPGWVVVLEKSKHFGAGHKREFDEAMDLMAEVATWWRGQGKPFWVLVGGPDGWASGYCALPSS